MECVQWRSESFKKTYKPTLLEPRGLREWPERPDGTEELGARSLLSVLEALAIVGETEPRALGHISALGISGQVMKRLEPMLPKLGNTLSQVSDVVLKFRSGDKRQKAKANHAFIRPDRDLASLRHFIQLFGMIKRLDLRFETTYREMTDFLGLVHGIQWKGLEDVTFGGILFKESDMITFIKDHGQTLTDLTLVDTCMGQGESWAELLENIRNLGIIKQFLIIDKMLTENVRWLYSIERFSDLSCAIAEYVEGQSEMANPLGDATGPVG